MSSLRDRLIDRLFSRVIGQRVQQAVKVIDDAYWRDLATPSKGPPWHQHRDQLDKIEIACRANPIAARLVSMTTEFVIGSGATLQGSQFAFGFWNHPQNSLDQRIHTWSDELWRSGELFVLLSRNPIDRMSYVRELPASKIDRIETDPDDLERELRYRQLTADPEGKWWPAHPAPDEDQVLLHFAINRHVGEIRGRSDLATLVDWLERYDLWLQDRVRINRYKGAFLWQVKIEGALPGQLEAKKAQYSRVPTSGSIIVTHGNETWSAVQPNIQAQDAEADGRAIRLMLVAGAAIPLHLLGEGVVGTHATAYAMNTATYRHFARKQALFGNMVQRVIAVAQERAGVIAEPPVVQFESVIAEAMRDRMDEPPEPVSAGQQEPIPNE